MKILSLAVSAFILVSCGADRKIEPPAKPTDPVVIPSHLSQCLLGTWDQKYESKYSTEFGTRNISFSDEAEAKKAYGNKPGVHFETKERFGVKYTNVLILFNRETDQEEQLNTCTTLVRRTVKLDAGTGNLKLIVAPLSSATNSWNGKDGISSLFVTTVSWGCYGSCELLKK